MKKFLASRWAYLIITSILFLLTPSNFPLLTYIPIYIVLYLLGVVLVKCGRLILEEK